MATKKFKRAKMVAWFNPVQLVQTGYELFISSVFGKHADRRLLDAALNPEGKEVFYDFSNEREDDFWIDYISDVGDGWDSTYGMARLLGKAELNFDASLGQKEDGEYKTKRGNILVFGGDEVYPTAGHSAYKQRLVEPYKAAFSESVTTSSPTVFAIPGNHDWYDSLVSFSARFLRQIKFAGWMTLQQRSYFAIKLKEGWWLFGTDMQLSSALDRPQMDYFDKIVKNHFSEGDSIILCNAEPHWIFSKLHEDDSGATARAMGYFEGQILKRKVAVYLAGDLHHYRRHSNDKLGKHKITSGGGGAFLHPTHDGDVKEIGKQNIYQLKKAFPDEETSRSLTRWNLLFPFINPLFGIATGLLYLLTAQAFFADIGKFGLPEIGSALHTVATTAIAKPFALFWVILILGGFMMFTDTHSKWYRYVMSPIHGFVHLAATFFASWGIAYWISGGQGIDTNSIPQILLVGLLIFAAGWLIGSLIMGLYLYVSLNVFGRHSNEAFSSLSIPDYKNFIRIKINTNGDLELFPVGVDRIPRKWKETGATDGSAKFDPDDSRSTDPKLIEQPFEIKKRPPRPASMPKQTPVKSLKRSRTKVCEEKHE